MLTGILLAMLGTALVAVLIAMVRAPSGGPGNFAVPGTAPSPAAPPAADPLALDAWDARKGDIVSVAGAGEDFSDLDFAVEQRNAYEASNHRWLELTGDCRGKRVSLEVYRYPERQTIGFFDSKRWSISDLNTTEDGLADLDARQDPAGSVTFEGKVWKWQSSREIGFLANEAGTGEGIYRWMFAEAGGTRWLCVEKREGEPFEVRIARRVEDRDVTVYRA